MKSFIFSRDFDDEVLQEVEERKAAEAAASPLTQDEIAALIEEARQEGHAAGLAEGREAGLAEAAASHETRLAATVEALQAPLQSLLNGLVEHRSSVEQDLVATLRQICEKSLPMVHETFGARHLDAELRRIARRAQGSRWLELRVAPEHREEIHALAQALEGSEQENRDVRVVADESLEADEIRASWRCGSSSWSHEKLCRDIMKALFGAREQQSTGSE